MTQLTVGTTATVEGLGTFQNYDINGGSFAPFAFSGAVDNATGDNLPASLAFPVNEISVSLMSNLIRDGRTVTVKQRVNGSDVVTYVGQVVGGSMTETEAVLSLSNYLDAVTAEFPWRFLTEDLVGPLPTTSNVNVR